MSGDGVSSNRNGSQTLMKNLLAEVVTKDTVATTYAKKIHVLLVKRLVSTYVSMPFSCIVCRFEISVVTSRVPLDC